MARSKSSRSAAAKRALSLAIAEETKELQDRLREKDAEIVRLHGVISQIGRIVAGVPLAETPRLPAPKLPDEIREQIDVSESTGPETDLAGGDNMGAGRWV